MKPIIHNFVEFKPDFVPTIRLGRSQSLLAYRESKTKSRKVSLSAKPRKTSTPKIPAELTAKLSPDQLALLTLALGQGKTRKKK